MLLLRTESPASVRFALSYSERPFISRAISLKYRNLPDALNPRHLSISEITDGNKEKKKYDDGPTIFPEPRQLEETWPRILGLYVKSATPSTTGNDLRADVSDARFHVSGEACDDIQLPIEPARSCRGTALEIRLMYFRTESQGSNSVYLTDAIIP